MSSLLWQDHLRQTIIRLRKSDRQPRIAFVGIGHELCGDDAAGVILARALQQHGEKDEHLLIIEAGPSPENFSGVLRRFRPNLVLLADAAQLDAAPGTVQWLAWQDTIGFSASTHTLPLHIFATYLTVELGCEVALLGIQASNVTVGAPLSPAVETAITAVVQALEETLSVA